MAVLKINQHFFYIKKIKGHILKFLLLLPIRAFEYMVCVGFKCKMSKKNAPANPKKMHPLIPKNTPMKKGNF